MKLDVPKIITAKAHVEFWSDQMSEHCLFFHEFLHDPRLKQSCSRLRMDWEGARDSGDIHRRIKLRELLSNTEAMKLGLVELLKDGQWIGAVWLSFVEHTLVELRYFREHLGRGEPTKRLTEVRFWKPTFSDHMGFLHSLLDPIHEETTTKAAWDLFVKMKSARGTDQLLELNGKFLEAFGDAPKGIRKGSIKSIVSPELADHVVREQKWGAMHLEAVA